MGVSQMTVDYSPWGDSCLDDHVSERISGDFLMCVGKGKKSTEYFIFPVLS